MLRVLNFCRRIYAKRLMGSAGLPLAKLATLFRGLWGGSAFFTWVGETFLLPLSAVLLVRSVWVGMGLWFVLLPRPFLALAGIISLLFVEGLGQLLNKFKATGIPVEARANGLLAGLMASWIVAPFSLSVFVSVIFVASVIVITLFLVLLFMYLPNRSRIPIVVWPYSLVAASLFILLPDAAPRSATHFDWPAPLTEVAASALFDAYSQSMGVIVYSPSILSGAFVAVLIFLWSPAMFLSGVVGWLAGAHFSMALVQLGAPLNWFPGSYNGFIAGMALGAVYLRPGWIGLCFAAVSGVFAALCAGVIQIQTDFSGLSYLPLPFVLTLTVGLLAHNLSGHTSWHSNWYGSDLLQGVTPEQKWISSDWLRARWGLTRDARVVLPVKGPVEIAQGVDGGLTHRGPWRHAIDLLRPAPATKNEARASIWGAPVYSPVAGQVISVENAVPDNPIGSVNLGENWGNHVLVRQDRGANAVVCHLMMNSVQVRLGDRVEFSTVLGSVGNSGCSSVPHLHLQMQDGDRVGGKTTPFLLVNYCDLERETGQHKHWHAAGMAKETSVIAAAVVNPELHRLLTGLLPGTGIWTSRGAAKESSSASSMEVGPCVIQSEITEAGEMRIHSQSGDDLLAEFDSDALRVVRVNSSSGSFVESLAISLSTIPYAAFHGLSWEDELFLPSSKSLRAPRELLAPFLGSCLAQVSLKCSEAWELGEKVFVIDALCQPAREKPPITVKLFLSPQRGIFKVSRQQGNASVTYELTSFELNTR